MNIILHTADLAIIFLITGIPSVIEFTIGYFFLFKYPERSYMFGYYLGHNRPDNSHRIDNVLCSRKCECLPIRRGICSRQRFRNNRAPGTIS